MLAHRDKRCSIPEHWDGREDCDDREEVGADGNSDGHWGAVLEWRPARGGEDSHEVRGAVAIHVWAGTSVCGRALQEALECHGT